MNQPPTKPTILMIDDEDFVRQFVARMLARHFDVLVAADGRTAQDIVWAHRGAIDFVLCDVHIGTTHGVDVWMELLNIDPALAGRIAFITGGTRDRELERLRADNHEVLSKTVEPDVLVALIRARIAENRRGVSP